MPDDITFRMVMTKGDLDEEKAAGDALSFGAEEPVTPAEPLQEARFLELVAVPVTGALATFAVRLADRWLKSQQRGTLIDLSKNPYEISLVRNIPGDTIVLIDKNGNPSVHRTQARQTDQLQSLMLSLLQGAI